MIERYRRPIELLLFGVLPVAVAVAMFATAQSTSSLSVDFHTELYPEAKKLLDWENPFPPPGSAIWYGHNMIWPPVAAFLDRAADRSLCRSGQLGDRPRRARVLHGLAADRGRPRLARLRRLRPLAAGDRGDPRLAPHTFLSVCSWRSSGGTATRSSRRASRSVSRARSSSSSGRWESGSPRSAGCASFLVAAAVAAASLLLVLPFTSLHDYFHVLIELGRTFDQESYSPFGFLMQIGAPEALAGLSCSRPVSCSSSRAGAVRASGSQLPRPSRSRPIVWLDYYAVAAIPLAVALPRLTWVWLAPLATWGLLSAGIGAGNGWGSARVLLVFGLVFAVIVRAERAERREPPDTPTAPPRPVAYAGSRRSRPEDRAPAVRRIA